MNILLLAPQYLDLYKPVKTELERIGHNVIFIDDVIPPSSPFFKNGNRLKNIIKKVIFHKTKVFEKYWLKKLNEDKVLNQHFDLLFCINGASFHPILLKHLRTINPYIRTSLYIWDTCRYYDYMYQKKQHFDKIYTFDYADSVRHNIHFLPFYWIPTEREKDEDIKYVISIVGSDHDGRYHIVEKIAQQLRDLKIPFYFKIVVNTQNYQEYNDTEIVTVRGLSPQETVSIMQASNCILDTDRECQYGATPRMIWALAMGKKIITTNSNVKELPFYDSRQFCIIDRQNPVVDIDFATSYDESKYSNAGYMETLCIHQWIRNFL